MMLARYLPQSRFSRRIFAGMLLLLVLFAISFVLFQQSRERKYRIEMLHTRLQDYNQQLNESLENGGRLEAAWVDSFLQRHPKAHLRLTIVRADGRVAYDNLSADAASLPSHLDRHEIATALAEGAAYDIRRVSQTLGEDFFYSATSFPQHGYVIRTALPYNVQLTNQLRADHLYLWFALVLLLLLIAMVWRFSLHLDRHILSLRTFADKAENGQPLDTPDLLSFADDELGEVAERIIVLYRRLKETRQEQDRLKRELTQNVAHELKTPVASIQGYLDTILSQPQMNEATRQAFLERSFSQVTRLTSLLRDILILNRLDEAPKAPADEAEVVDLGQVVALVRCDTERALLGQKMRWDVQLPADEPIGVLGTEKLVYSIFRNLTDNAIAYAGAGCTITLRIERTEGAWHILFADNGQGVSAEHLPRLFERFYRVDKGRSREIGGTGLGLSIVKNSVLALGGEIGVENAPAGGLCFRISLPACGCGK